MAAERDFQRAVLDLCRVYGYTVAHFRPAQTGRGWRTPVAADGAGFPDLVIAGHGRVLFRELKAASGRVRPDQAAWLGLLERCGADAAVWRPGMWPQIVSELNPNENVATGHGGVDPSQEGSDGERVA